MLEFTFPETNSKSTQKMDDWKMILLLGLPIFRGELLVSGRVRALQVAGLVIGDSSGTIYD